MSCSSFGQIGGFNAPCVLAHQETVTIPDIGLWSL